MDAERLEKLVRDRLGREVASIEGIEAGLGTRRFLRLRFATGSPASIIARCEPEASETAASDASASRGAPAPPAPRLPPAPAWLPEPALEPIRTFLEEGGIRVPRSFGHFPELGVDLLEDVGTRSLLRAEPAQREALYSDACDFVARLQSLSAPPSRIPAFGRRYDRALVVSKGWKWLHWTVPALLGRAATALETREIEALFSAIAEQLEEAPRRLAHRDFKAENLHLHAPADAAPDQRPELVVIDVQGAFLAPPEYDLACLLDDLQADLDEAMIERRLAEILPALPDRPSPELARRRFDAIAIARLCKDVSHVVHAGIVRADRRRWHEIPRGLELLGRASKRLQGQLPGLAALDSVIQALTAAIGPTDIVAEGMDA